MNEKSITILQEVRHLLASAHREQQNIPPCIARSLCVSLFRVLKIENAVPDGKLIADNPQEIPDVPDWRENTEEPPVPVTADEAIAEIRRCLADDGEVLTLSEQIDRILNLGITRAQLAGIMGVNPARITEAYGGKPRKSFLLRFAELFGNDGGASGSSDSDADKKTMVRELATTSRAATSGALLDEVLKVADVTGADLARWLGISAKLISNVRCGRPSPAFTAAWNAFIRQEA